MQKITRLYQLFESHPALTGISLPQAGEKLALKGIAGSAAAFIIPILTRRFNKTAIVVVDNKEDAAFLYSDISKFHAPNRLFFFPSSFKRSLKYGQTDPEATIQRTDVISAIPELTRTESEPAVIITYPDALFEKIADMDTLGKNTLHLAKGEKLSPEFIHEVLTEYGFERVDFVYQPGQFSIRGGIVDVFSYSSSIPYRIDFFGDTVDSIRTFNVENQLSNEPVDSATIIANLQQSEPEHYTLLTDLLQGKSVVWTENSSMLPGRIDSLTQMLETTNLPTHQFASGNELIRSIEQYPQISFGLSTSEKNNIATDLNTSPQPRFNKNFELLARDIEKNSLNGYTTYFLADNPKQHQRIENILHTINPDLRFSPIEGTLHAGFIDHKLRICLYTDHQIFDRYHRFSVKHEFSRKDALTMKELLNLQPGDFVVHIDHGIGVFAGLVSTEVNGSRQEAVRLVYRDNDSLLVNVHNLHKISKYRGKDAESPKIHKLGTGAWQKLKQKTKSKIKDIAKELIALYAKRKAQPGFAFSPDSYMQQELEASFIYEDTPDQEKATRAVKEDMESPKPMDRLVCGDVGFGKTEIAVRAAFKAVADSKQVAVLVPTTILALQHYRTFSRRLQNFPCSVEFINRMKSTAQQREIKERLARGHIDIIIGTHALLKSGITFKDLGLLIIDEEQKFGVSAKEKLKKLKLNVDTLTLTATPIPRTLQFSLMGARDLSIINTPPPNRQPILTELHTFSTTIIQEAILYEVSRGGQVFFVHNRVENIEEVQSMIHTLCPKIKSAVAHGQMEPAKLEQIMLEFINGNYDVLISTAIIESGLDIPNANTIIINNAQMFGLSDLHQLRGRVGRSNKKAFCFLLAPPLETLSNDARRRLKAIEEFSELGSGFSIAMQDLDIRGAGNLLGGEQSGFIAEIGFETYQQILDEAIEELKQTEFKSLFGSDTEKTEQYNWVPTKAECQIETDLEILIPSDYVSNTAERIKLYREIDRIENESELERFITELTDRFGPVPSQVTHLFTVVRIRWVAIGLGLEKIIIKNQTLLAYFISNPLSPFYRSPLFERIIGYIQQSPNLFKLKEVKERLRLSVAPIEGVENALDILQQMDRNVRLT